MDQASESRVMDYVSRNIETIPFKTLRHGETELAPEEQLKQMQAMLHNDPGLFLSKWGRYLSQNTLRCFEAIKGDYEVDFYLKALLHNDDDQQQQQQQQQQPERTHKKSALQLQAHNRRYQFLQHQLRNSDYFSDESIQLREPVLYDQYIGQHIPAREREKPFESNMTLVNRIYSNMDKKFVSDHLEEQRLRDEEQFEEEEEEDSDDEIIEKSTPTVITKKKQKDVEMKEASVDGDSENEGEEEEEEEDEEDTAAMMEFREEQRAELMRLLEESFLAGKDDFDYDQVDHNEEYDDLHQLEQDIHDRYFDEDD